MDAKTIKALVGAGAIKKVHIIARGATIHVEVLAGANKEPAHTGKGDLKTWRTLDAAAKWVRGLGVVVL